MRCRECGDEVDALYTIKVGGKGRKICEDCLERRREEGEVAMLTERAMSEMMGVRERW